MACRGLARALVRRGHRLYFLLPAVRDGLGDDQGVTLVSPGRALQILTEEELSQYDAWLAGDQLHPYATSAGALVHHINGLRLSEAERIERLRLTGGYGPGLYREIELFSRLAEVSVADLDFHLIHAHDWMTYPAGLSLRQARQRPLVCHVHATEKDRSGDNVNQYVYDLERHAYHACDQIITVSNFTRDRLIHEYAVVPDKIAAVHNGLEFELGPEYTMAPVRPFKEKIVLFLGRITFQKGPDYFVAAARKVIKEIPGVRFVMVGTGDMYHRMIEMAADLGIGKYFHYTGFLDRAQVKRIYRMSDLYVMPSVSEPFGLTPLEALSEGVPVILSRQSGASEVLQNCIKVDFWDTDQLARSIIKVLEEKEATVEMIRGGQEELGKVTWEMAAERVEEVYYGMLS